MSIARLLFGAGTKIPRIWPLLPMENFYWLLGFYLLIQILDGNVLVPILFSTRNNLHPAVIIVAILFFGGIWGFWGLFFAIPLATFIKAIINSWPEPID